MSWLTDRLERLMIDREFSVEGLARQLAVERSYVAKIVAGEVVPTPSMTRRLARQFEEDISQWLSNAEPRDAKTLTASEFPTEYVKVASVSDLATDEMIIVWNNQIALARIDDKFHAFGNICPHAGGPIGEGFLDGCIVECPWHGGRWDVRNGEALTLVATADIPVFDVRVVDGEIEVRRRNA